MFPQTNFRLTRQAAMLALISTAFPCASYAAAPGHIDFAMGNVNAIASDGRQRALTKGSEVAVGETINTNDGRAQIRFSDGAYVSLQPQTQFRVDDYKYDGKTDGSEKGFFSLLKGGLRSITGLVGRVNKQAYQVTTPTATIGIRGTEYLVKLDNGLRASVGSGSILLKNEGGSLILNTGQSGYVANKNTAPVVTFEKPTLPPEKPKDATAPEKKETYTAGEDTKILDTIKAPTPDPKKILTGTTNYNLAIAHADGGASHPTTAYKGLNALSTINSDGVLESFNCCGATTSGTTTITSAGNDGIIAWGRWTNGTLGGSSTDAGAVFSGANAFYYIIGAPTVVMPTTGSATYTVLGSTQTSGFSLTSATFNVNFGTGTVTAAVSLAGPQNVDFNGTASITGSGFVNGGLNFTGVCTLGCSGNYAGIFAGTNASRAGMVYQVTGGPLPASGVHGAIALTQ